MSKPYLFIDRDGTLIKEPPDQQIDSLEKLEFLPGMISNLGKIASELNFGLVMVSNQDGLGSSSFPERDFWPAHNLLMETLRGEGIEFEEVLIDRSLPGDNAPTRKPGTALLMRYIESPQICDLPSSYVIGDRATDLQLAKNLGCRAIYLGQDEYPQATLNARGWPEIYCFLRRARCFAEMARRTNETDISCQLALYGNGRIEVSTGIGFLDHMLSLLAFHAGFDLRLQAQGDRHVDEHHTIEDTALVLGEALARALGDKRGIERYGFVLPMDESSSQVLVDLSGRAKLIWDASWTREKIGDFPTEMFSHFFESFAHTARLTLHIQARGDNQHHQAEAIFKACGRALRLALARRQDGNNIGSTKGSL